MLRRCILELSSSQPVTRVPRQITTQLPFFLSSRTEFSVASQPNASHKSAPTEKPSGPGNQAWKLVLGSLAISTAFMAAYQNGYIGHSYTKEDHSSIESNRFDTDNKDLKDVKHLENIVDLPSNEEPSSLSLSMEGAEKNSEAHSDFLHQKEKSEIPGKGESETAPLKEAVVPASDMDLQSIPQSSVKSDDQAAHAQTPSKENFDKGKLENDLTQTQTSMEQNEGTGSTPISGKTETEAAVLHDLTPTDMPKGELNNKTEPVNSLLDAYFLREKDEESPEIILNGEGTNGFVPFSKGKENSVGMYEDLKDVNISSDGKLVFDFIQAIHAAERKQAESDARIFAEEKRILKEKYEKELKDTRARELMYAEEAAILDKELDKERVKAAAMIKSLQEKAEENLKMEIQSKEEAAELQLKKVQELAKAELAAAMANEKSSQIEKIAEANLHINALCMAFYARSEEARQSYSVHKLALGALALEDALSKGLPIQTEIDAVHAYLEGIDRDSFLDLVLSSLPKETLIHGTDTHLQLNQKFDALKKTLRHFSLIPIGGGGILTHTLAHVASSIKMRENDQSGEGIESVISRVDSFLAEGKLAEAADALEGGVCGSQAEEIVGDWVRLVRNRAITEQALSLLQSYATSISLT